MAQMEVAMCHGDQVALDMVQEQSGKSTLENSLTLETSVNSGILSVGPVRRGPDIIDRRSTINDHRQLLFSFFDIGNVGTRVGSIGKGLGTRHGITRYPDTYELASLLCESFGRHRGSGNTGVYCGTAC